MSLWILRGDHFNKKKLPETCTASLIAIYVELISTSLKLWYHLKLWYFLSVKFWRKKILISRAKSFSESAISVWFWRKIWKRSFLLKEILNVRPAPAKIKKGCSVSFPGAGVDIPQHQRITAKKLNVTFSSSKGYLRMELSFSAPT